MNESKHTPTPKWEHDCDPQIFGESGVPSPSPWRWVTASSSWPIVCADGRRIADVYGKQAWQEEGEANAKLMVAAPGLLAACKEALRCADHGGYELEYFVHNSGLLDQLRAAVESAEGE